MKVVNVTEFRHKLTEYLVKVRRGQRIRIVSHGQIVAEVSPPSKSAEPAEAVRARLRGSVLRYDMPLEPVIQPDEWKVNR